MADRRGSVKGRKTPEDALKGRKPSLVFRQAREGDIGPALKGKVMADLTTGPDRTRTVWVNLSGPAGYIDFVDETERTERGLYKLEAGTLTMCFNAPGELRPTEFKSDEGGAELGDCDAEAVRHAVQTFVSGSTSARPTSRAPAHQTGRRIAIRNYRNRSGTQPLLFQLAKMESCTRIEVAP